MTLIDRIIFGNGRGLSAPTCHQVFYWLVDIRTRKGCFYHWSGWFGAQLASFQWTHPNAGERREFLGSTFRPVNSVRRKGRVRITWSTDVPKDLDEANDFLRNLKGHVSEPGMFD